MDRLQKYPNLFIKIVSIIYILSCFTCVSSNLDIKNISIKLSQDIDELKIRELGIPFISKLYSNFKNVTTNVDVNENVRSIARKLETKIVDVFAQLLNAKSALTELEGYSNATNIPSTILPCHQEVNLRDTVSLFSAGLLMLNASWNSHVKVSSVLQKIGNNMGPLRNALKQQYFISEADTKDMLYSPFSGCKGHSETIIWNNYMSRNKYRPRNIVLVLDHGGALSKLQLQIVKSISKEMIASLNSNDNIALIGIARDWESPANSSSCLIPNEVPRPVSYIPTLKQARLSHKRTLYKFIDSLEITVGAATNHALGIRQAVEVVKANSKVINDELVMILYISRGLLSSLTEVRTVLETMAQATSEVNVNLTINTCAVIDESKSIMYETHFLQDIAEQNYIKYNITINPDLNPNRGTMIPLNSTDNIGYVVNRFNSMFNTEAAYDLKKRISLPTWDPISKDLTMSFTLGWSSPKTNFALLGADVYFSNLAEDVIYYSSNQQYSYAFLIDYNGRVLMHPFLPRPSTVDYQMSFVDISKFEKTRSPDILRAKLLTEPHGNYSTTDESGQNLLNYHWSEVGEWYIVCIVINTQYKSPNRPFKVSRYPNSSRLLYQNWDRTENYRLCRHFSQIATIDAASLYLSMSCFQSPFAASKTTQDKQTVEAYLAYLKDETRLLANPGFKEGVRDEVKALAHVLGFLEKKHHASLLSKYIVRRYAASHTGVLQIFPGSFLSAGFEPTKRLWYLNAMKHKGKVVFIPPYLDGGGAGYIVTITFATPHIVVAMDVSYGYMYKMLLEHMSFCLDANITCFLMDDRGYLVFHPNLMDVNGARPVEQQHIVHKESLVANDILLSRKQFIRKLLCNNYGDSTIQRYYRLNMSYNDVLANFVPAEHCVTYQIVAVPNTNLFVGVVNATCKVIATFCPCSVIDRLCLNCNRMEQKECECPCECPLSVDTEDCINVNRNITDNSPCSFFVEDSSLDVNFLEEPDRQLDSCFPYSCHVESFSDCLGLIGCEWCKYDVEGNTLDAPFCASISTCFHGVTESTPPTDSDYSPVGPILGSVIAMCVLFILLFVCYRSYTSPSTERLYLSSTQDNQLRMSDLNVNDNYHDLGNHRDKLLQEERPDPVSPYCVASTYRRTTAAADSDHGYSTMTPHDESEHLSLAPVEVDSLEDDLTSDNTSIHTSISTKHNDPSVMSPPCFTRIPNRNCIVVPVTVHRNMEAT